MADLHFHRLGMAEPRYKMLLTTLFFISFILLSLRCLIHNLSFPSTALSLHIHLLCRPFLLLLLHLLGLCFISRLAINNCLPSPIFLPWFSSSVSFILPPVFILLLFMHVP